MGGDNLAMMTGEQLKQLSRMKKLINQGYKRFANRKDRDYIQELLDIGITEEMAWSEIFTLSAQNYAHDYKPSYAKYSDGALTFKKMINGCRVYIKIKIEKYDNNDEAVCLSFHIDHR